MEEKRKNYSTDENYNKLYQLLDSLGLTYDDIKKEFEAPRTEQKNTSGYTFAHGKVLPTLAKITPERIQNGSYGGNSTPTLKAWFERDFRNSSISENLGDYGIIEKIQNDPYFEFNVVNNKLYLYEDGNHRLFNYLLLAIIDQKKAKTGKEANESRNKFTLKKNIHFEHPTKLIKVLDNYSLESFVCLPEPIKSYITSSLNSRQLSQPDYLDYNPQDKTYNLHLEGRDYNNLSDNEATKLIETAPTLPKGVKIWKSENNKFNIVSGNRIYSTKSNQIFSEKVKSLLPDFKENHATKYDNNYYIANDLDSNKSMINVLPFHLSIDDNPDISEYNIFKFKELLLVNRKYLKTRLPKQKYDELMENLEDPNNHELNIPDFSINNLSINEALGFDETLRACFDKIKPQEKKENLEQGEEE